MLTRFGDQISSIYLSIDRESAPLFISRFWPTLYRLPNLKILRLSATIRDRELHYFGDPQTFPCLSQLESLDLIYFKRNTTIEGFPLALPFVQHYGSQLKVFACQGAHLGYPANSSETLNTLLPNLKCFKLAPLRRRAVMKLAMVQWKLEQLHLYHLKDIASTLQPIYLIDIMRVLNNFGETLENLELMVTLSRFDEVTEERVDTQEMNILPKLRTMTSKQKNMKELWFCEFLERSCVNLKELHFQMSRGEVIQAEYVTLSKQLFEILRKLEKITFWGNPKVVLYR
ncbi:unnamed protein product [Orchesella dallaii]|uniref:Uncharacterized protein n=1 Tax=Orchesella dallaii TaxID=48710 RepID=A0ABP1S856_9HEXA